MNTNDEYFELGYTPQNLKKLRKMHNLTQTQVGERTGTALRTVQNWEADVETKDHAGMPHRKWVALLKSVNYSE